MSSADDTPVGIIRPLDIGRPEAQVTDELAIVDDDRPTDRSSAVDADHDRRRRRRPWLRRTLIGVAVVVVLVVGYFAVSLYQVWSTGRSDQTRPVDAIVVLGAAQYDGDPSPQLAARLDHVVELWPQQIAPLVVATGGSLPGDRFTEAEASAAYLTERGVPSEAILLENAGTTTYESLEAVAAMLDERGLDSVLIVTDPYHSLRSRLIAQDVGLTAYVSPTPTSVVTGGTEWGHNVEEALGVMIGRIIGFENL